MRQSVRLMAFGLLTMICGLFLVVSLQTRGGQSPPSIEQEAPVNQDCGSCHAEIYSEWQRSAHARSWTNEMVRHLSEDFKNTECIPCHAPQPVLDTGILKDPVARTEDRSEGIGCLCCHRKGWAVVGPNGQEKAPCRPEFAAELKSSDICRPCHQLHGLFDEWAASPYARNNQQCQDCHMPTVERRIVSDVARGGMPRLSHRHDFHGGEDADMLRRAIEIELRRDGAQVIALVKNVGAGHNVPGQLSERALICTARMIASTGDEKAYRDVFCLPPRYQRGFVPNTQIKPGEFATLRYPTQGKAGTLHVQVLYKRFRFQLDSEATIVKEASLGY